MERYYTGDTILIAQSGDDLQHLLFRLNKIHLQFKIKLSIEKTKCMITAREPLRCRLNL